MTGIEPAVYAGFVALVFIVGTAWKFLAFLKNHVEDEVKPVKEKVTSLKSEVAVIEGKLMLAEEKVNIFKLEVARTYTTKEDVLNANKPVIDSVERLTHSVDKMNTRIDRVIEQSNAAKTTTRRRASE